MTQLVGLDVGTTGVKALALSPAGEVLARAEESYELSTPRPGWAEQDPEDWWRAAERALARLGGSPGMGRNGAPAAWPGSSTRGTESISPRVYGCPGRS